MASTRGYELAVSLETAGYHLRMTRDLDQAKDYFDVRCAETPDARYGLVDSSRDKILAEWGIPNDHQSTKVMRLGPLEWNAGICARTQRSSSASCAQGQTAVGRAPVWSCCPKRKAGDRYAVPDQGQCRLDLATCQSAGG
jgi:hypothetical protein